MVTKDKGAPGAGSGEPEHSPTVEDRIEELRKKKKAALTPGGPRFGEEAARPRQAHGP